MDQGRKMNVYEGSCCRCYVGTKEEPDVTYAGGVERDLEGRSRGQVSLTARQCLKPAPVIAGRQRSRLALDGPGKPCWRDSKLPHGKLAPMAALGRGSSSRLGIRSRH